MSDNSQNRKELTNLTIYKASAGSGKTFQLTKDYIFLLFSGLKYEKLPHRRILAVTFTNKATAEMKSRILQELHILSKGEKSDYRASLMSHFSKNEEEVNQTAKKILIQILYDYSAFSISTIDSFFQQVIRTFAHEIGVNSGYGLELEGTDVLQQAVDNLFINLSDNENKQLLEWLTELAEENIEQEKAWNLNSTIFSLGIQLFKEDFQIKAHEIHDKLQDRKFLREYKNDLYQIVSEYEKKINFLVDDLMGFIAENGIEPEDFSGKKLESTLNKLRKIDFDPSKTFRGYAENVENCYTKTAKASVKMAFQNCYSSGLQSRLLAILNMVDEEIVYYNSAKQVLKNLNILGVFADLSLQMKKLTDEQNILLISDTNLLLNKIIDDSDAPFIYERVGTKIDHFMIDEFQDTSVLQWKNFKPLIINSLSSSNYNMVVGDIKQSIYRFRNSEWQLLNDQISKDLSNFPIKLETLSTNWRSDKNIISFNNQFFTVSANLIQDALNAEFEASKLNKDLYANLSSLIKNAYKKEEVEQKFREKAEEGYVRIEFIPEDGKKDDDSIKFEEKCLEKIPKLLEDLVDRGYNPADVAFLVREKNDAKKITNFLLNFKKNSDARPDMTYNVVGNEGLPLSQSSAVNFIMAVLTFLSNPKDEVNRTTMNYEYFLLKNPQTSNPFKKANENVDNDEWEKTIFTTDEKEKLKAINNQSLIEITEKIIQIFKINEKIENIIFLQAFQDVIFTFMNSRNGDLNGFLEWWKQNETKQIVNFSENEQSFKIMTIHKAKGLDFKVVIVPFLNWDLDDLSKSQKQPILWLKTDVEPFSKMPILPVKLMKDTAKSIFKEDYFKEKLYQNVDNLNLVYVAFTRARNEMYCFAPLKNPPKENKTIPTAYLALNTIQTSNELSSKLNDELVFELGKPTHFTYSKGKVESEGTIRQTDDYPTVDSSSRLLIKYSGKNIWDETSPIDSKINYGVIMHEILQNIIHKSDVEKAIYNQMASGKISGDEAELIRDKFVEFWEQKEVEKWFTTDVKVLNEATILLPSGKQYRPDRIVFTKEKVIVVDYKFGEEHKKYSYQLKRYSDFLSEMGYQNIESYLYYVGLKKIVKGE